MRLLYWYETCTRGNIYTVMDRCCAYFGAKPVVVDCLGAFKGQPGQYPIPVPTLDVALEMFADHKWVFLHSQGKEILDEFEHPEDPVIYAIGSNTHGFSLGVDDLPGMTVRLRKPEEVWDYQTAQMVLYDRMLYQTGRRR